MRIPEGSTAPVYYTLRDKDGEPITNIVSLQYKVTAQSGTVLLNWTTISTPASSGVIYVSAIYNVKSAVVDTMRFVTVKCTYDVSKVRTKEISYELEDLIGI